MYFELNRWKGIATKTFNVSYRACLNIFGIWYTLQFPKLKQIRIIGELIRNAIVLYVNVCALCCVWCIMNRCKFYLFKSENLRFIEFCV